MIDSSHPALVPIAAAAPGGAATRDRVSGATSRVALLIALLPLFGQTFHYMKDLRPMWALSKALPLVSLPLALPLLTRGRLPLPMIWLAAFLWLVLLSSTIGIFTFDQPFLRGLTAQVKLLPMLYCLSFLGVLLLARPSVGELQSAFAWCAGLTFLTLVLLWAFAPQSWYAGNYEIGDAPLLSVDDRGNRIRMPMYFGMIGLFWIYRRLLQQRRSRDALLFVLAIAVLVGIVKTRAVVLATGAVLVCISFIASSPRGRVIAAAAALIGALALMQIPYLSSAFDTSSASGFDVRATTIAKATAFLGDSPGRWLFGVGTISSLDPDGMVRYFNHFFFLADISWLGVVFEFGLVGAAIIALLMVSTLVFAARVRRRIDAPFLAGLQDYVLFTLLISPLYSTMTLQPGEIAVIAACFVYCSLVVQQTGVPVPAVA